MRAQSRSEFPLDSEGPCCPAYILAPYLYSKWPGQLAGLTPGKPVSPTDPGPRSHLRALSGRLVLRRRQEEPSEGSPGQKVWAGRSTASSWKPPRLLSPHAQPASGLKPHRWVGACPSGVGTMAVGRGP